MDEQPSQPPSDATPKQSGAFVIILSLLAVLLAGTTAYLAYQNAILQKEIAKLSASLPSPSLTPTPSPINLSKTYIDDKYQLGIPETWIRLRYNGIGLGAQSNPGENPRVSLGLSRNNVFNFEKSFECHDKTNQTSIILDGKPVTKTSYVGIKDVDLSQCGDSSGSRIIIITLDKSTKDFLMVGYNVINEAEANKSLTQILSTFKFLNPASSPPVIPANY